ncbi:PQQ-binding-like beta-propeller repeat protein [Kribbella sp. NPDC051587]|uniref:outer membrane protein assembly factor BamB family protein n=1 Tax=Kribbella sp. NPDC051587 TaxID=3364119 RepID=UPI0037B1FEC8
MLAAAGIREGRLHDARHTVQAFDPATGMTRWKQSTPAVEPGTPLVHDGCLYLAAGQGSHVYALDAATGTHRWQAWPDIQSVSSIKTAPAIYRDTLYVGSRDHRLYALNATTGETRWHVTTGGEVDSSPTVTDGTVYFGSADGHLWAVSAQNGQVRWKVPLGAHVQTPVVADGVVYLGTQDGHLYAVDAIPAPRTN